MPGYKEPPKFTGNYTQFVKEVGFWSKVCGLQKKDQGMALALTLRGTPRMLATSLNEDTIYTDDGLGVVLGELKKLYAKDSIDSKFKVLTDLERYERPEDVGVMDYIAEFENLYNLTKDFLGDEVYADYMKAFKLIKNANLSDMDAKIVRSALTDWKYEDAVKSLKRIFGSDGTGLQSTSGICSGREDTLVQVKEEVINYNDGQKKKELRRCYECGKVGHIRSQCYKLKSNTGSGNYNDSGYHRGRGSWRGRGSYRGRGRFNNSARGGYATNYNVDHDDHSYDTFHIDEIYEQFYALNHALLDSGASRTVVGEKWLEHYEHSLDDSMKKSIKVVDTSDCVFRFGDSPSVSHVAKKIPLVIGDSTHYITARVVGIDIPLLISLESMKDMRMTIDFDKDIATIWGEQVNIRSEKGHYLVPLIIDQICLTTVDKLPSAVRLHRAFGHSSSERIIKVLRDCNMHNPQIEKDLKLLDQKCDFCEKFRRRTTNPSVSLLRGKDFNDLICLDLKFITEQAGKSTIVLHVIDHLTKFSAAKILKSKTGEEVVRGLMLAWISLFGPPKRILSDNGLEFCNKDINELCEMLGIDHKSTASYAPFSNGLVERHNSLLANMLKKIKADLKVDTELGLCWAVNAKNTLSNISGYSPYQLTFGKNPNIGGVTSDEPVLLDKTTSQVVGDIINSIQKAREAFIKTDNSNKLKRALKAKVENSPCENFKTGDSIVYRRSIDDSWLQGEVIGQLGATVWIDKGGQSIKAHFTNVRKRNVTINPVKSIVEVKAKEKKKPAAVQTEVRRTTRASTRQVVEEREASLYSDSDDSNHTPSHSKSSDDDDMPELEDNKRSEAELEEETEVVTLVTPAEDQVVQRGEEDGLVQDEESNQQEADVEDVTGDDEERKQKSAVAVATVPDIVQEDVTTEIPNLAVEVKSLVVEPVRIRKRDGCMMLKKNDMISYELDAEKFTVEVMGRSDKVTSRTFKNRFNVIKDKKNIIKVNLDDVKHVEVMREEVMIISEESDSVINLVIPDNRDDPEVQLAKKTELDSLKKFETFEEIRDSGQQAISSKWVIQEKTVGEKRKVKARLVCRGFEDPEEIVNKESPTVDKTSVRMFMSITAMFKWEPRSFDVKAAFLQSEKIDRTVYVKPPRDIKKQGIIWLLKKPLYGLSDSSRNWYFTFKKDLLERGFVISTFDKAVFLYRLDGKLQGILTVHVDDVLYSGTGKMKDICAEVAKKFELSRSEAGALRYVGIDVGVQDGELTMSQLSYMQSLKTADVTDAVKGLNHDVALSDDLKTLYRSLVGKLNWLSCNTRPEIKFDVYRLSSCTAPSVEDLLRVKKTIRKLKHGPQFIIFPKLATDNLTIIVYTDAALGNLDNGISSCKAFIIFLYDGVRCCPVNWATKKITRVCTDTLEAETRALIFGIKHGEAVRESLCEILGVGVACINVKCIVDCLALRRSCYSENNVSDPTLRRVVAAIQQKIKDGKVMLIEWTRSAEMLADTLTKSERVDVVKLARVLETGSFKVE